VVDRSDVGNLVGIDDIAVYVPRLFISAVKEFASSRGIEPEKLTKGIGVENMAVPDFHEDAATMAAMSILELMKRNDLRPGQVGRIYVGTESGVDESKAIGTYVIGMLEKVYGEGSFQECSTVEFKFACIGATHALENVAYWLKSQDWCDSGQGNDEGSGSGTGSDFGDDMVGIVVASDIARYDLKSPGEYTQGAGSVSLLVKKNPRLIAFDPAMGVFTKDENDFFRPIGMKTAVVDGKYSNLCYLSAMGGAFESYKKRALNRKMICPKEGECVTDYLSHIIFHIPYPRMAEYASAALFRKEWSELSRWNDIEEDIGNEPVPEDFKGDGEFFRGENDYRRRFSKTRTFLDAYEKKVKPSTIISAQIGNIYTGSIYLGLASLFEERKLIFGERVGFGSYGSGCSAIFFSGVVQPGIESLLTGDLKKRLDARTETSLKDYELLHEGERGESVIMPSKEFALIKVDQDGYRHYDFVS